MYGLKVGYWHLSVTIFKIFGAKFDILLCKEHYTFLVSEKKSKSKD